MFLQRLPGGRIAFSAALRTHQHHRIWIPRTLQFRRAISTEVKEKYTQKLQQKAAEKGTSVDELLEKSKSEAEEKRRREGEALKATFKPAPSEETSTPATNASEATSTLSASTTRPKVPSSQERKDATPFKPLSSFLSLPRLFSTPHTPEQISALWTAYHASRSGGTGRGYICATIPVEMYKSMEKTGKAYSSFVVPIRRVQPDDPSQPAFDQEDRVAHEFYFLQWGFHPAPPTPSAHDDDPFAVANRKKTNTGSGPSGENPQIATVLFTPLQEFKLRQTFATPYLVLTMYTDLAASHGLVLLRGEITPGSGSGGDAERFMLSQEDAQQLTLALQKFYLWSDKKGTESLSSSDELPKGQELLRTFHEKPEEFEWKELVRYSDSTI